MLCSLSATKKLTESINTAATDSHSTEKTVELGECAVPIVASKRASVTNTMTLRNHRSTSTDRAGNSTPGDRFRKDDPVINWPLERRPWGKLRTKLDGETSIGYVWLDPPTLLFAFVEIEGE